ncbi:MAG: NGG1p interacting factor NIF3 [Euryarchaeota archaeon]|nr:NGG1p interacting factor NIF3 [Euryarchaeota archaeon]
MRLGEIYRFAVEVAKGSDPRTADELEDDLRRTEERYRKMEGEERARFDLDSLWNPYPDSRLVHGDPATEVGGVLWGIDISTGEMVLADRLRERGIPIDAVIGHHPFGRARPAFGDALHLHEHIYERLGIPINVAEDIMAPRIREVHDMSAPANYDRAVDAARLLGLPLMCLHSVTDNLVDRHLSRLVEREGPRMVGDVVDLLLGQPEHQHAARNNNPPEVYVGDRKRRAGKVVVRMTGGTSGPKELYEKLADAGVGTAVFMHIPESHLEEARKHHMNVVIAGHVASDSLGMNLLADRLEERGVEVTPCSGFIRVRR